MPTNPFIELAKDPVSTLAWVGYGILLVTVIGLGLAFTLRKGAMLLASADLNARQRAWWGEAFDGWLPPAWWIGWAATVLLVWVVIFLALATLVWVIQ